MSRLTDFIRRHAERHQPIDLSLLDRVIRQERWTGSLEIHYQNGQPKLLSAGRPVVAEVESADPVTSPISGPAAVPLVGSSLTRDGNQRRVLD